MHVPTRHLEIKWCSHTPDLYLGFIRLNQGCRIGYYGHQGVRGGRIRYPRAPGVLNIVLNHEVFHDEFKTKQCWLYSLQGKYIKGP